MSEPRLADQLVFADVVRELHAIADAAGPGGDPDVVAACRRAESLLARLRDQFVFEVAGEGSPSGFSTVDAA